MTISKLHNLDKSIHQNPRRLMALNYAIKKLYVEIDKQNKREKSAKKELFFPYFRIDKKNGGLLPPSIRQSFNN